MKENQNFEHLQLNVLLDFSKQNYVIDINKTELQR